MKEKTTDVQASQSWASFFGERWEGIAAGGTIGTLMAYHMDAMNRGENPISHAAALSGEALILLVGVMLMDSNERRNALLAGTATGIATTATGLNPFAE